MGRLATLAKFTPKASLKSICDRDVTENSLSCTADEMSFIDSGDKATSTSMEDAMKTGHLENTWRSGV
jgi:hypothetical protein